MSLKKMYKKMPAILKRTACAKGIGALFSLAIFIVIILTDSYSNNPMLAWGILLWYPMVGVMIGFSGTMDKHPLLGKMGIWRGIILGAFMNLILILFAIIPISELFQNVGINNLTTPFIIFAGMMEGAIIGGFIDWYVTTKFGEGKKLMKK